MSGAGPGAAGPAARLAGAFGRLLRPVVAPRKGLPAFLAQGDLTAFPLFSVLLLYFLASLGHAYALRGRAGSLADVPVDDLSALIALLPFLTSLGVLLTLLLTGLALWIVGVLLGARRPYGQWVGLSALVAVPGLFRLLLGAAWVLLTGSRAEGGFALARLVPGTLGVHPVLDGLLRSLDPFSVWALLVLAFGVAAYAGRSPWAGAAVAAGLWALQAALPVATL